MTRFFRRYRKDDSGSIMPLTAILLPVIIGMAGVGIDLSAWSMSQRNLQTAADAAAIAAAWEIANNMNEYAEIAALREAQNNGYNPQNGGQLQFNQEDGADGPMISVTISQKAPVWFSGIFINSDIFTTATATSTIMKAGKGKHCLLSLDDYADGAITINGNVSVDAETCGIAVNSNSNRALDMRGNVKVDVGDVQLAGDYSLTGNASFHYASLQTGAGKIKDPYADLQVPDSEGFCDYNNFSVTGNGNRTLWPGTYCGGISISGNTHVYLENGVYIIDGGDFSISGNGTLSGDDVTIILTSSSGSDWGTIKLTGNKDVYLSAPKAGNEWEGVLFYGDRNAPNAANRLTGNGSVEFDGVVYFPSQHIDFGGNKKVHSPESSCSHIIARTLRLHGNPDFRNDCEDWAVRGSSEVRVRLIM